MISSMDSRRSESRKPPDSLIPSMIESAKQWTIQIQNNSTTTTTRRRRILKGGLINCIRTYLGGRNEVQVSLWFLYWVL